MSKLDVLTYNLDLDLGDEDWCELNRSRTGIKKID